MVFLLGATFLAVWLGPWAWRRLRGFRLDRDDIRVKDKRDLRRARRQARRMEDAGNYGGAYAVASVALAYLAPRREQGTARERNWMRDRYNEWLLDMTRLRNYETRGRQ